MWISASSLLFYFVAAIGILLSLRILRDIIALRLLPARQSGDSVSRVSVVIAARDEAARIETTVRHLLAQIGVELEVIVVDDRSTDGTTEILTRLATEDNRLRVVRVDQLPAGWLGKCHACEVGAAMATGEWILFTDGDIWLKSDVVARAVQQAETETADHVTLMPGVRTATFLGQSCS